MQQRLKVAMALLVVGVLGLPSGARAEEQAIKGRGVVTAINLKDSKHPTVTLGAQGWELLLQVDPEKTPITKNNQPIKVSDIRVGDDVYVTYKIQGRKNIATLLWMGAPQASTPPAAQLPTAQAQNSSKKR